MDKLRKFIDLTKEEIGYIVNLISLIYILYALGKWIISNFLSAIPIFKIGGFLLLLIFLWALIRNARKLKSSILYYFELKRQDYYEKQEEDMKHSHRRLNFKKIVPQTRVLGHLYQKGEELAKKEFSRDSYLTGFGISISLHEDYEKNDFKKKIAVHSRMEFHSPLKRMKIEFSLRDLSLPKMQNSTLEYREKDKIIKPFFYDKFWREAVLTVFDRREAELLGKYFHSSVWTSSDSYIVIAISPYGLVKKQYLYFYKDGKLYEDSFTEDKIIKNFSK